MCEEPVDPVCALSHAGHAATAGSQPIDREGQDESAMNKEQTNKQTLMGDE